MYLKSGSGSAAMTSLCGPGSHSSSQHMALNHVAGYFQGAINPSRVFPFQIRSRFWFSMAAIILSVRASLGLIFSHALSAWPFPFLTG